MDRLLPGGGMIAYCRCLQRVPTEEVQMIKKQWLSIAVAAAFLPGAPGAALAQQAYVTERTLTADAAREAAAAALENRLPDHGDRREQNGPRQSGVERR